MSPYSRLVKPAPSLKWFLGKKRFHSPNCFALAFSLSTTDGHVLHLSSPSPSWLKKTVSDGIHSSSTNFSTLSQGSISDNCIRHVYHWPFHTKFKVLLALSLTAALAMIGILSSAVCGLLPLARSRWLYSVLDIATTGWFGVERRTQEGAREEKIQDHWVLAV